MSDEVHKIIIQTRRPRGTDPGAVAIGHYCVADGFVVLTDEDGKPLDSTKRHLGPGDDARLIACRLLRQRDRNRTAGPSGFNRKLSYPKLVY